MAARLNGAHAQDIRDKIKTTQLINRLQSFALGEKAPNATADDETKLEIDGLRLKAMEILLRKSLPDLSAVVLTGPGDNGEHTVIVSASDILGPRLDAIASRTVGTTKPE